MKEITSSQQFEGILKSTNPIFVDFWAEWCVPCKAVSPAVEELAAEYKGKIDFVKINIDQNNQLVQKYNILSIPTLAIFENGDIIAQIVGAVSKDKIRTYIDSNVN